MKITLTYNGVMQIPRFARGEEINVADGATPADVMTLCEIKPDHQKYIIPFINNQEARAGTPMKEKDELSLFLPLGGG
ncbi:MAG: hypothetical protein PHP44_13400 [Kiritimatiellae bacterium]|nr:hypothetical protein [Kiritimatiellia bacterium]MDD4737087.1 hypothetical protein [Kiritimatiellia bacterium]